MGIRGAGVKIFGQVDCQKEGESVSVGPMEMEFALIGAGLIVAAAIIVVGLIFLRGTAAEEKSNVARLNEDISRLGNNQADLIGRLSQLTEAQTKSQESLGKTVNDRLDQLTLRMNHSLTEQTAKTTENLANLQERLGVIDAAQKNITELSGQVVGLQDILANKQARGAFGEIQLEDIVRDALPPQAYDFQHTLSNGKRADCVVHMPNAQGSMVIDAKFPLEGFRNLRGSETKEDTLSAQRLFKQSVKKHISDIAARYIIKDETSTSALMFLPSEAVYAELYANFDELVQEAHKARVYIVSPNTLMATLLTVSAVLRDVQMREQAHLIQAEVGKMAVDVKRLTGRVENLSKHFGQAEKDIREITTSAEKVTRRAEAISEVQLEDGESVSALPAVD